eukprot:CAMPEP_0115530880 /NCGR_PEP_ID=MMETSP0271-20121206/84735_1 /TAXON_ID=71861 /ORGANISM="Scrippsiella trochoidea, Strain CCMP3099" /LENGTH=465 /DNA_ID=CAMNT_0002963047 /DNA_START=72 /DNA_END=1466 /DNA_ORIENTATION=+
MALPSAAGSTLSLSTSLRSSEAGGTFCGISRPWQGGTQSPHSSSAPSDPESSSDVEAPGGLDPEDPSESSDSRSSQASSRDFALECDLFGGNTPQNLVCSVFPRAAASESSGNSEAGDNESNAGGGESGEDCSSNSSNSNSSTSSSSNASSSVARPVRSRRNRLREAWTRTKQWWARRRTRKNNPLTEANLRCHNLPREANLRRHDPPQAVVRVGESHSTDYVAMVAQSVLSFFSGPIFARLMENIEALPGVVVRHSSRAVEQAVSAGAEVAQEAVRVGSEKVRKGYREFQQDRKRGKSWFRRRGQREVIFPKEFDKIPEESEVVPHSEALHREHPDYQEQVKDWTEVFAEMQRELGGRSPTEHEEHAPSPKDAAHALIEARPGARDSFDSLGTTAEPSPRSAHSPQLASFSLSNDGSEETNSSSSSLPADYPRLLGRGPASGVADEWAQLYGNMGKSPSRDVEL